ncbi:MAG TPA: tail fiber domain-containing protein, partial [Verrucomicrobiota bacterium]|nr:tail fiber domain-containing protein [Verrucomicrobiota bacterium]
AGRRCRVNHRGAFVFSDSQNASFASAGVNTLNVRFAGGFHASGDTSLFFGTTTRQMLNLWGTSHAIGVQSGTTYFRTSTSGAFSWHRGGIHSDSSNNPGSGGVEMMRLNSTGLRVNGTFVSASDRALKDNLEPLDPHATLDRVLALPLYEWNYLADPGTRHAGPMAQDFQAAFGLGADDKTIAAVDADAVALAAIQGLNAKLEARVQDQAAELAALRGELAELRAVVRGLARPGSSLTSRTGGSST